MAYYTNRPCQCTAGDKNWKPNNFLTSCVIYAYILVKISVIINNHKKLPKNNNITSYIGNKLNTTIFKSLTWTGWVLF